MIRFPAIVLLLAALALLPACASVDSYPSLAQRPAERAYGSAQAATPSEVSTRPPPVAPDGPLGERIAAAQKAAAEAHRQFTQRQPAAERLTAGSPAPQSDGWSLAQVAVSELIAARTQTSGALADLDHMLVKAAEADPAAATLDTIGAARERVGALVGEEDAVLAKLAGRLRD